MRQRISLLHRCKSIDLTFDESTISEFKRKYEVQLRHSKNKAGQETAKGLTAEKSGRSLLEGKFDNMVQTYIRSASNRRAVEDQWRRKRQKQ